MDKKNKIKLLAGLSSALALSLYLPYEHEYNPSFVIHEETADMPFASYKNGDVYIGNKYYIDEVMQKAKDGDVFVECGYRSDNGYLDPNIKIYSSYKINDKDLRNDILMIILIYDNLYPSDWNRSIESMRVEWTVHNLLYDIGYERARTRDVDLDNLEEEKYNNKILRRIIK